MYLDMDHGLLQEHEAYLQDHRYVNRYSNAREYLIERLGFQSEIAPEYEDVSMENMFRIHSYAPRNFLILQKNPNLRERWCQETLHGPHCLLENSEVPGISVNIDHSRTTVAKYLYEEGGQGLKLLLHAVDDVINDTDLEFESIIDQRKFEEYFSVSTAREYDNNPDTHQIGPQEGFFGDFAYTNVCKFQAPGDEVSMKDDDLDWLELELATIQPNIIFSMGGLADSAIQELGFEYIDGCDYSDNKEGNIYEYEGNSSALEGTYVVSLYHFNYPDSNYGRVIYEALKKVQRYQ